MSAEGFDPNQPRDERGRWTDSDASVGTGNSKKWVESIASMTRRNNSDLTLHGVEDAVAKHGMAFKPPANVEANTALMTKYGIPPGKVKGCFEAAGGCVLQGMHEDLVYVEGFADSVIPVHHAWLATRDGQVIDPTWNGQTSDLGSTLTPGNDYYGIPFTNEFVSKALLKSGTYGIFGGYDKFTQELYQKGLPPGAVAKIKDTDVTNTDVTNAEDGVWRTIRGNKVFIKDGKIAKGPKPLRGKSLEDWKTKDKYEFKEVYDDSLVSTFTTKSGRKFIVSFEKFNNDYLLQFTDDENQQKITGKGEAFEVFRKVGQVTKQLADERSPRLIEFNAQEESRRDLYRFFVKRANQLFDNYQGVQDDDGNFGLLRIDKPVPKGWSKVDVTNADNPDAGGVWRTIRGARVFIEDGVVTKGPKGMRGKKAVWAEDTVGDTSVKFKRATYDRLYTEWEVDGRKFGTLFTPDYSKEFYEVVFGEGNVKSGSLEYSLTGRGSAFKVMSEVGKQTSTFIEKFEPTGLVFSAQNDEQSRVDFYRFLAKRCDKLYPDYIGVEAEGDGNTWFGLIRRESLEDKVEKKYLTQGSWIETSDYDPGIDGIDSFKIVSNEATLQDPLDEEPAMFTAEQLAPKHVRFV